MSNGIDRYDLPEYSESVGMHQLSDVGVWSLYSDVHAELRLYQKRIAELEGGMKTISKIKELKGDPYLSLNLVIDIANEVLSEGGVDVR